MANTAQVQTQAVAVLRARGLSKVYVMGEVEVHALREIDVDIYEGEFIVLLGPSGSGKSKLPNILGGLDAASSGIAICREAPSTTSLLSFSQ